PGQKGLKKAWIQQAVENSLRRLNTDYIDLYFAHWPDPETPIAETLSAFHALQQAGKIRATGASNLDAQQLSAALEVARKEGLPAWQVLQPEYNLYHRSAFEGALCDLCISREIGVVTYYSLASGFLTGKYRQQADLAQSQRGSGIGKYLNPRGMRIIDTLEEVAAQHHAKPGEVALAWLMGREGVTAPIASATSVAQVESFARAAQLTLNAAQLARLEIASA
ncbi:TPA: aldo/keto reductase, partial [Raoultella ornithinolytica]